MKTPTKVLLTIPTVLLLIVVLLLTRITDVGTFLIERELRAAGFTDIVVDIQSINSEQASINNLKARHPTLDIEVDNLNVYYSLFQLLDARIDSIDVTSAQIVFHEPGDKPAESLALVLPSDIVKLIPFDHASIKQAQIDLPDTFKTVSRIDIQADITRNDNSLDSQFLLSAAERPPVQLQLGIKENNFRFELNDGNISAPAMFKLQGNNVTATQDDISSKVTVDTDLKALHLLLAQWLPIPAFPESLQQFDSFSATGLVNLDLNNGQLHADADINLAGETQNVSGLLSLAYLDNQLELIAKENFHIETGKQVFAQATTPSLNLSVQDDINCNYHLGTAAWQCGTARVTASFLEVQYPPYTFKSNPLAITLQQLQGDRDNWHANVDIDMTAVKLTLPDNVVQLDKIHAQLQASTNEVKAAVNVQAADGSLGLDMLAHHDMRTQTGKADITLKPVSLDASHNIPGKLLERWPYPVHIEAGKLHGKSTITWLYPSDRLVLDQQATLQLDELQGQLSEHPFTGLTGKLHIKGIDKLQVTSEKGIKLANITPGVPITDILVRADATRQPGKAFVARLRHLEANTLGGMVSADNAVLDFNQAENRLVLDVQGLDIEELIKLEQKEGLHGTGKLNGKLPIIINKDGISMEAGTLAAEAPYGVIQYTGDERVAELAKNNPSVELLVKALTDFRYDMLEAELSYAPDGKLLAKLRLQGKNPELEGGRPVHLNINLEENIITLLRSLQFADEISREVEKGLEKKHK